MGNRPKTKKISTPLGILLILLAALLAGVLVWRCWLVPEYGVPPIKISKPEKQVTITTDKTEYELGETVGITIKNNSSVINFIDYPIIENLVNNEWMPIKGGIVWAGCWVTGGLPYLPLEPNILNSYQWDQREKWCSSDLKDLNTYSKEVLSGTYRVKSRMITRTKGEAEDPNNILWQPAETIYSNEFTIKERESIGDIHLTIKSDKQVYEVGEDIKITFEISNLTSKEITLIGWIYGLPTHSVILEHPKGVAYEDLPNYFSVKNSKGKNVEYWGIMPSLAPPTKDSFMIVPARGSIKKEIALVDSSYPNLYLYDLSKPDKYTLKATYINEDDGKKWGLNAWTGTLVSNTITIEVKDGILSEDDNGNFVLYVSNQSFAINPVDIKVYIDGKVAVDEDFDVEGKTVAQHNWYEFQFSLAKGLHRLEVESVRGEAKLEKEFEIKDKHWAVIDYWYYPEAEGGVGPTPKHFSFDIQDEPIYLE